MRKLSVALLCSILMFGCKERAPGYRISDSFLTIEQLRKEKPINFVQIRSVYERSLKPSISMLDIQSGKTISDAILKGEQGQSVELQSQAVSKGIQKAVVIGMRARLQSNVFSDLTIDTITDYYNIISPTVVRRGEWIGRGREIDDLCRGFITKLESAPGPNSKYLDSAITAVYALSVLFEFEGIQNARGNDSLLCEEKMVEGVLFWKAIRPLVTDTEIAARMDNAFSRSFNSLDIEQARRDLEIAFEKYLDDYKKL